MWQTTNPKLSRQTNRNSYGRPNFIFFFLTYLLTILNTISKLVILTFIDSLQLHLISLCSLNLQIELFFLLKSNFFILQIYCRVKNSVSLHWLLLINRVNWFEESLGFSCRISGQIKSCKLVFQAKTHGFGQNVCKRKVGH